MAVIKCKMCGGDLDISEGLTVCECEYCGTKQTVPTVDDEKKITLFNRAGRLLRSCEFDKAAGVFESIVADFPEEAEAYWGLVLCKFGIEYVDDPATGKKVPTCHRSGFDSVMEDADFEQACENADAIARRQYREEAKAIEELRRGIIEVSGKEQPYDIFICYKETDENGGRTVDSVIAQDVYDALTAKGYRVFFSRITLEDKLGQEYEPYIFAALNSAKIMLAFGTDFEYFNAVWVKNEWSRFLKLMEKDKSKHLIPCYKGIDAYDMPKEFARLQAQDMGKVGAVQDLLRGIEKLLPKQKAEQSAESATPAAPAASATVTSLLQRGNLALEDREWDKARDFFDRVLDANPQCAEAYLGLAMADSEAPSKNIFETWYAVIHKDLDHNKNVVRAKRFGDSALKAWFEKLDEKLRIAREKKAEEERLARERKIEKMRAARKDLERYQNRIAAGANHTVGLKEDGTVVAVGVNKDGRCDVSRWTDIVAVAAGFEHTVGLKSDGTAVAVGRNRDGQRDVSGWTDIVAAAAGGSHTVGLKSDGTVVAVGYNSDGRCDVSGWTDIVAVAAGGSHTVGLKSDGTVVAVGHNEYGQCDVSGWTDIVAVAAGRNHTVGLKSDGTVVAVGHNEYGQCYVSNWKLFRSKEELAVDYAAACAAQEAGTEEKLAEAGKMFAALKDYKDSAERAIICKRGALTAEKARLTAELPTLKGLFSGGKRKQIEARLAEIDAELAKL